MVFREVEICVYWPIHETDMPRVCLTPHPTSGPKSPWPLWFPRPAQLICCTPVTSQSIRCFRTFFRAGARKRGSIGSTVFLLNMIVFKEIKARPQPQAFHASHVNAAPLYWCRFVSWFLDWIVLFSRSSIRQNSWKRVGPTWWICCTDGTTLLDRVIVYGCPWPMSVAWHWYTGFM